VREPRVAVMLLHDPDSGAVVDVVVYEDGIKAGADAHQAADDSGCSVQIWTDRPFIPGILAVEQAEARIQSSSKEAQ
jgi:hypothetical protein